MFLSVNKDEAEAGWQEQNSFRAIRCSVAAWQSQLATRDSFKPSLMAARPKVCLTPESASAVIGAHIQSEGSFSLLSDGKTRPASASEGA